MRLEMTVNQYLQELKGTENAPMDLQTALAPFKISAPAGASHSLLMGHLFDAMREDFAGEAVIDIMDTLQIACELGHPPADEFIELAPYVIFSSLRSLASDSDH